ncbi:PEP-CTERM sorting domain-containing protein [Nostocaceae cyanobacterium CENA369]|uniref:PEP-CTERM sorting domain-containing protein n=1 Tax=Dendronalium phyllosphericum CENA369 TaxID=1725256 RepID=A0A8J7IN03_9NOST|nr:PEP-CTERM sorting domain-containing protein [Dendronalium phyllosphericum]MBH8578421.1 PEP-CTERM sorting domain-containing protein [Dendronalium phyllosphericum CENA369]
MKLAKQLGAIAAGVTFYFAAAIAKPAEAAFVGAYEPSKWTLVNIDTNGYVNTSDAPAQIQLYGGDTNSNILGTTDYKITAVANGVVNFKWNYLTEETGDGAAYDPFSFVKNDISTDIFSSSLEAKGQGTYSTTVAAGDVFSFRVTTKDNRLGRASVTISDFNAPVPEPLTVSSSAIALGFGWWLKRRQIAS